MSQQYDGYTHCDNNGTGTFTAPNMSPDDVVVQRNNETLGSRASAQQQPFGSTTLTSAQLRHDIIYQDRTIV